MIRYELRDLDENIIGQLIELSKLWVEEDCSHGMVVNEASDLQAPVAVALDEERIVGYCFGHSYIQEKRKSYMEAGKRCFELDELYVLPRYRGAGIGGELFRMMEREAKETCDFLTLATSTKNYKAILKLYIEELGMNFHSAFLIKNLEEMI